MVNIETIRSKYEPLKKIMDERTRRIWAAGEAKAIGWGGISTVATATGMSRTTITGAMKELTALIEGKEVKLNFENPKNSRSHPIISQIPKYRRLNPTQNRYQSTPRNILNFAFIPRCRGKVLSSHRTAAPRFSRF